MSRRWLIAPCPLAVVAALGAFPTVAGAHGPIAPIASSYLARIGAVPPGLQAKVVDGDQRMWLRVPRSDVVVILDYRGAPYLRFTVAGVAVNQSSAMYYLNQTPVAETPPATLTRTTPPVWHQVSGGHEYNWHDGRLHALASVALAPGQSYVGRWIVPLLVGGRLTVISGGLWHADSPSWVWFWPIAVLLLCVLAARRLRRPTLDTRLARILATAALAGVSVAALARGLHGRPGLSVLQLIEVAVVLVFVGWATRRLLLERAGAFTYFLIAFVAIWEGAELIPTLRDGFVLAALPAVVVRTSAVVCLGTGVALLPLGFRIAEQRDDFDSADYEDEFDLPDDQILPKTGISRA
jgi:hypothetical protein